MSEPKRPGRRHASIALVAALVAATSAAIPTRATAEPASTPTTNAATTGPADRTPVTHNTADTADFELFVKGFVHDHPAYAEPFEPIAAKPFPPDVTTQDVDLNGFQFRFPADWSPFVTSRPRLTAGGLSVSWANGRGDVLTTTAYLRGSDDVRVAGAYSVTVDLNGFRRDDPALAGEVAKLDDLALMERLVEARRTLLDPHRSLADRRRAYLLCNAFFSVPVARLIERDGLRFYVSWSPPRPPSGNVTTFGQAAVIEVYDVASRRCLGKVALGLRSNAAHPDELRSLAIGIASTARATEPATRPAR